MSASAALVLPDDVAQPTGFLRELLAMSLTAVAVLRPLYDEATGAIHDFAWVSLNPAGQRMLGQPEHPTASLRMLFPVAKADGVFDVCCQAFATGELQRNQTTYQAEGLDGYFLLVAQRYHDLLLVNFTATNDQPRTPAEQALRESQAREQAAHAEAERQRQRLQQALMQLPASIALLRGPEHIYDLVTPEYERLLPNRSILGRSFRAVIPELDGQGFYELFDQVYQTGEPFYAPEIEVWADFAGTGELQRRYYRTSFQPIRNAQGQVEEVLNFSVDVTAQVETRQQLEQLTQQLAATQAVAEHERSLLQALFTQAPVAIALFQGSDVRIASANEQMAALWGRTPAQVVGRPLLEALPELAGQGFDEMIQAVQATHVPYIGTEAPADLLQDGKTVRRYYNFSCHPIYDAQQALLGVVNVGAEVTEQVLARQQVQHLNEELAAINQELRATNEEYLHANAALREAQVQLQQLNQELETRVQQRTRELAEQQELLGQVLKQVPAFIATLSGPEHRYTFFNEPYQVLAAGRARRGHTVAEVFPEVVAQGFVGLLDQVYATGEPFIGTDVPAQLYDAQTGYNEPRYVDFIYQPLLDAQQRVQGILAFILDVTARVQARQQTEALQADLLAAAQRRAQERQDIWQLFAHAPLAVALLREPDHQLDYRNALFDEFFPGAQPGIPLEKGVPALATSAIVAQLDGIYKSGETYQSEATLLPGATPGAPPRYVLLTYQAYREHERIAGVALFLQDVTEQVLARQQVQNLNAELAAANENLTASNQALHATNTRLTRTNVDLDSFVYAASHDLKAPIANIEGLLGALREYLPTQEQEPMVPRLVSMMEGAITRFQQTVGHLTDVSHLQDELAQPAEAIDVAALLEAVRLDLRPLLESTHAEVVVAVEECPHLLFSTKNLRSVLFNLLSNAVKYRAPDRPPVVQVRTRCTAAQFQLEVQDNGLGLTEQQQHKLFTMFRRLHTHVEGSGVGLYLIKRTIENAGGTIAVRSEAGVGTTFTVLLPRA